MPREESEAQTAMRERIIKASIEYMSAYGSEKLSMVEVARAAKVARATVYSYFSSKEDLIRAAEESLDGQFFAALHEEVSRFESLENRAAAIAIFLRKTWTERDHTPWFGFLSPLDEAALIVNNAGDHIRRLAEFTQPFVVEAQSSGEIRKKLDPARTSEWIARICLTFALAPANLDIDDSLEVVHFFEEHLVQGLR